MGLFWEYFCRFFLYSFACSVFKSLQIIEKNTVNCLSTNVMLIISHLVLQGLSLFILRCRQHKNKQLFSEHGNRL